MKNVKSNTRPFKSTGPIQPRANTVPKTPTIDIGVTRPWRIALLIKHMHIQLVFDLIGTMTVGRGHKDIDQAPDIDLRPFDAENLGVSRQHLKIKLEGDRVVIVDNNSSNKTLLNDEELKPDVPYAIGHGAMISLGALELQVSFLINPFEQ